MTSKEADNYKKDIYSILSTHRIHDAIALVSTLVNDTTVWQLHDELNQFKTEYNYLINYFINGMKDPDRDKIYNGFIKKLYSITDKAVCEILIREDYGIYYSTKRTYRKSHITLTSLLESYQNSLSDYSLYCELPDDEKNINNSNKLLSKKESIEIDIFKYIWTSYPQSTLDLETITSIFKNNSPYPDYFKSHVISAIMLSLLQYYNDNLFLNLLELYDNTNDELSIKSLCAAIIVMYNHSERIDNNEQIKHLFELYAERPKFENDVKNILFTLVKSRNTEKITKKVHGELIPKLMKFYPKVFNKIKGEQSSIDISDLEENPQWKDFLENEKITKKIEELNRLQLDGGDVLIGTFSHLKSFPFFNEPSNWFLPFHSNHSIISNTLNHDETKLIDVFFDSKFFCDSDKYSFIATLATVPQSQRNIMLSQLNEQNATLSELKKAELPTNTSQLRENIINNYIQNIYRFYNIFNRKNELINPLNKCFDIIKIKQHFKVIEFKEILAIIAEFYLKNDYFNDAARYYIELSENYDDFNPVILQKAGFCYQNLEHYEKAIKFYHKYELYAEKDLWNLRHLAACYRALKQPETALKYYLEAIDLAPDNIPLNLNIGHCYLETDNYAEALKYYFKIYYLEPTSLRSLRPLAWCLFVQKNFEQSRSFYDKILQGKPNSTDYLNMGHLEFVCGNISVALSNYKNSIVQGNYSIQQFIDVFLADENILLNLNVKKSDISILLDALSQ